MSVRDECELAYSAIVSLVARRRASGPRPDPRCTQLWVCDGVPEAVKLIDTAVSAFFLQLLGCDFVLSCCGLAQSLCGLTHALTTFQTHTHMPTPCEGPCTCSKSCL